MISLDRLDVTELVIFQHSDRDRPGSALAQIGVWVQHPHWPHLTACAYATISVHRAGTFLVDGHLGAGDASRTQWSLMRTFDGRNQAATEAADFLAVAVELLARSVASEPLVTPGQRRGRAARRALERVPARAQIVELLSELKHAIASAKTLVETEVLTARRRAARDDLHRFDELFLDRFHIEHHWSAFVAHEDV